MLSAINYQNFPFSALVLWFLSTDDRDISWDNEMPLYAVAFTLIKVTSYESIKCALFAHYNNSTHAYHFLLCKPLLTTFLCKPMILC